MSLLVAFLVVFPLLVGGILLFINDGRIRNALVVGACAVIALASVVTVVTFGNGSLVFFGLPGGIEPGIAIVAAEAAIALVVIVISLQYGRRLAPVLAAAQLAIAAWLEVSGRMPSLDPERLFGFDRLSMIMVLIVGIIGTLICVHALGYMRDYQRSYPQMRGRRTAFFSLLFLFLSAMFGLVTANYLPLLLVFWEVTTLCSFLLIGYTRTDETVGYAFRALNMNLIGGLGFSVAILLLAGEPGGLDLARLTAGPAGAALLPAIALLALAGITKSAQLPFSSWLLGAMYAPSPTSALLHSSTMVKAGVFLLLRLSPAMAGSAVGSLVAFTGLLTFLFVSFVATTEQNTKKVLAYSTIGTLGLIVGCAGIGGSELMWVGVMLIVFHAIAKSLLFLVVGTLENRLYTKDMEHFDALLSRMPRVSVLALTGIAGMFIAPFGIVLAKWSAIRAFLEVPGLAGRGVRGDHGLRQRAHDLLLGQAADQGAVDPRRRRLRAVHRGSRQRLRVVRRDHPRSAGGHRGGVPGAPVRVGRGAVRTRALPGRHRDAPPHRAGDRRLHGARGPVRSPRWRIWSWRKSDYDLGDFYASGRSTNAEHVDRRGARWQPDGQPAQLLPRGRRRRRRRVPSRRASCAALLLTAMVVAGMVLRA